jgi:hypothetical protein
MRSRVELRIPAELTVVSVGQTAGNGQSPFLQWEAKTSTAEKDRVRLEFEARGAPGRYPAQRYAEFHQAYEAARRAARPNLLLKRSQ